MMLKAVSSRAVVRSAPRAARPALPIRGRVVVRAQQQHEEVQTQMSKALALATAATTMLSAGNAQAASELMELAAGDNRAGVLLTLLIPVLGWVAFNITQPALNQLARMEEMNEGSSRKRGVAAAIGLSAAALFAADNAEAATEVAQLAAGDNRLSVLLTLLIPVLGWVAFNITQPALNQLARMEEMNEGSPRKKRSVVGAAGLGAAAMLLAADNAEAATEVAQLAAGDNRIGVLFTLLVPVLGWVAFNITQPALNQLARMEEMNEGSSGKKRSVVGAAGLGAAAMLLAADNAEAATEVAQLAAGDNRIGVLFTLLVPVLGWVAFNITQPALNQLARMEEMNEGSSKKRGVVGAAGLGAAAMLLAADNAEAATEVAQLAAGDNRIGVLFTLLVPVLGWVAFNITQPALNQLARMQEMNEETPRKRK